jgi:hypothetical protein
MKDQKVTACSQRSLHDTSLEAAYLDPDPEPFQRARDYCYHHGKLKTCPGCGIALLYTETHPPKRHTTKKPWWKR